MKKQIILITLAIAYISTNKQCFANSTISINPKGGTLNTTTKVSIEIDSSPYSFNAAEASIAATPNLSISSVSFGDCGFSFIQPPSIKSLSFSAIILGKSAKKCTAYTIEVSPVQLGSAAITITNSKLQRFGDAADIKLEPTSASYQIDKTVQAVPVNIPSEPNDSTYNINIKVINHKSIAQKKSKVVITSADNQISSQSITNSEGIASFTSIQPGIYKVTFSDKSETILNITGNEHALFYSFSINTSFFSNNLIVIILITTAAISAIAYTTYSHFTRRLIRLKA